MFKQFRAKGFTLIEFDDRRGDHRDLGGYRHPELPAVSDEVAPVRGEDQPPGDRTSSISFQAERVVMLVLLRRSLLGWLPPAVNVKKRTRSLGSRSSSRGKPSVLSNSRWRICWKLPGYWIYRDREHTIPVYS